MDKGLPIDWMTVHQRAKARAGVLNKITAFPWLQTEMCWSQPKMGGHGHLVGEVRTNGDAAFGKKDRVTLGSAEFGHG